MIVNLMGLNFLFLETGVVADLRLFIVLRTIW